MTLCLSSSGSAGPFGCSGRSAGRIRRPGTTTPELGVFPGVRIADASCPSVCFRPLSAIVFVSESVSEFPMVFPWVCLALFAFIAIVTGAEK